MTSLYEAMEALKQYYLKKVQDIIDEQNAIKKEDGESSVSDVDRIDEVKE